MTAFQIFLSSPGDVVEERLLAQHLVMRLKAEFAPHLLIEPIFWEHDPLRATASFQEQILRPSKTDVVVVILWSRLGTRLPGKITRSDGTYYSSGTEFEFEDALEGYRDRGVPDLLVYRKTAEPVAVLDRSVLERLAQKEALDAFIDKWFRGPDGSFTGAFHPFNSPAQFIDLLEKHLRKLIRARITALRPGAAPQPAPVWTAGSPFRGLELFQSEHASIFFGRTQAVSDVLNCLRQQAAAGRPFVMIFGASGAGKSSLARAGILPLLTRPGVIEGIGLWRVAILRPGESNVGLMEGFVSALITPGALPELASAERSKLSAIAAASPDALGPLIQAHLQAAAAEVQRTEELPHRPAARLFLLIDQMEEIFTDESITGAERQNLIRAVSALVQSGHVWAVATMRSDFYSRCSELPELQKLKEGSGHFDLRHPTAAEIGQIIRNPARMAGLTFEQDAETEERLDDTLRDAAMNVSEGLALLEFTLEELYRLRRGDGTLTLEDYREIGGCEGALGRRAEEVFGGLPAAVQASFPAVMRSLVAVGLTDEAEASRRAVPVALLNTTHEKREFVECFIAARLFVADRALDGTATVQVTHESLLRRWPRLEKWIRQNRARLQFRARLVAAAALWASEGKLDAYLMPAGEALNQASSLLKEHRDELPAGEISYIETSRDAAQRKRRRNRILTFAAVASVLVALGAAFWYWNAFYRENVSYYRSLTFQSQVPAGFLPIGRHEASHRSESVRITRRKGRHGRVDRIEIVNGKGHCVSGSMIWTMLNISDISSESLLEGTFESTLTDPRPCRLEYTWKADGKLDTVATFSANGEPITRLQYVSDSLAYYSDQQGMTKPRFRSGAAYLKSTLYDSGRHAGLPKETHYLDAQGHPQPDADGIYGGSYEYDACGPVHFVSLGADGKPAAGPGGLGGGRVSYTAKCRLREATMMDPEGRPLFVPGFGARFVIGYDSRDNTTDVSVFDTKGHLFFNELFGFARVTRTYDDWANPVEVAFLGADNNLVVHRILGFALARTTYDANGNELEGAFYGASGKPQPGAAGYYKVRTTYDVNGHVTGKQYFGADDRPVMTSDGYALARSVNDEFGNHLEESFYGVDGQPVNGMLGYFRSRMTYDAMHHLTGIRIFDINGKPTPGTRGCANARFVYDSLGYQIEESCYGVNEQPVLNSYGVFRTRTSYDADYHAATARFYGTDDQPILNSGGFATAKYVVDDAGNRLEESSYGLDGKPVVSTFGYFRSRMTYDVSNRLTGITYFDTHDRMVTPGSLGYARREISYSSDGVPDERVFDVDGQRLYPADPAGFLSGWRKTPFADQKNRTVLVAEVIADSQAERAGVRPGDVVVSYNGTPVDSAGKLRSLTNTGLGYRKLQIERDGKTITMDVSVGPLGIQLTEK